MKTPLLRVPRLFFPPSLRGGVESEAFVPALFLIIDQTSRGLAASTTQPRSEIPKAPPDTPNREKKGKGKIGRIKGKKSSTGPVTGDCKGTDLPVAERQGKCSMSVKAH